MRLQSLILRAPAKVNLTLRVTGRRADGYHLLDTLMQKVALFDRLELRPAKQGVSLSCPGSELPEDERNLVHRAATLFLSRVRERLPGEWQGVELVLDKAIPVAAGLGGGSSDAAATLVGMNDLLQAGCTAPELAEMGLALGADVPFFVSALAAARARGIGEELTPVPELEGYLVLLVNPGFAVSTKWAYETLALTSAEKEFNLDSSQNNTQGTLGGVPYGDHGVDPAGMVNDLEKVTVSRYGEIGQIKKVLLDGGAEAALMSGSGPTVFALFPGLREERARECLQMLRTRYPHVFLVEPLQTGWERRWSASGTGCRHNKG